MSTPIFDATQVAPQTERTAWPKGRYKVMASTIEAKSAGSGKGTVLHINFKSMEGPTQGQTIMGFINWKHETAEAESIGRGQLSALCHAVGVLRPMEFSNLCGIALCIDVDTREFDKTNKETGVVTKGLGNDVKGYRNADGSAVVATVSSPAAPVTTAPPASALPWETALAKTPEAAPVAPFPPVIAASLPPALLVATAPPAVPVPSSASPAEKLYYIANSTELLTPQPVNAAAVKALNLVPAEVKVCEMGSTEWVDGEKSDVFGPPWLRGVKP